MVGGPSAQFLQVEEDYVQIEWLQFDMEGQTPSSSAECIEIVTGASDHVLVSRCIFRGDNLGSQVADDGTQDLDGIIYSANTVGGQNGPKSYYVDNCLMYNLGRAGIHMESDQSYWNGNCTFYIDHCTIGYCGTHGFSDYHGGIFHRDVSTTTTFNIYNCAFIGNVGGNNASDIHLNTGGTGSFVGNGTHNADGDNSFSVELSMTRNLTVARISRSILPVGLARRPMSISAQFK